MSEASHQLLIVDDHSVVRRGLQQLVEEQPDLAAVWTVATVSDALEVAGEQEPDLALIDVSLGNGSGIELAKQLHAYHPELPILMVSMHDETLYAERALAAGARGYIMKQAPDEEVLCAIRRVLDGRIYVSKTIRERLFPFGEGRSTSEGFSSDADSPVERLSDRELEVFLLLGRGFAPRHIAEELAVSVKTVESHRRHLKEKLNLEGSAELTRYAVEWARKRGAGEVSL
jgi:DNA-binding NarL/FixJ family response regulator